MGSTIGARNKDMEEATIGRHRAGAKLNTIDVSSGSHTFRHATLHA